MGLCRSVGLAYASLSALFLPSGPLRAGITIEARPGAHGAAFEQRVKAALAAVEDSPDPSIGHLYAAVAASPAPITMRAITDDPTTWHDKNDRHRPHTEPADRKARDAGRTQPTSAILYVPPDAVERNSTLWRHGAFVHELVHEHDIAYGLYARENPI